MQKKTVAVIFGGHSPEYAVSLESAAAVLKAIDREQYTVIPIGITAQGDWLRYYGPLDKITADTWHRDASEVKSVAISPSRSVHGFIEAGKRAQRLDLAFPVLHGCNGEDGSVQGLLQLASIPTVGCGVLPSALCMDKYRSHALVRSAGIPCAKSIALHRRELDKLHEAGENLGYPLFVKPLRAGSSFGISRVCAPDRLPDAAAMALKYDETILLEEALQGFEVGCAVMGTQALTLGRVDEIELAQGFFDFEEKYTLKTSQIHMPARIDAALEKRIQHTAEQIYRILGCSGFARVDMFLTSVGDIYFNEVNTIPGFTAHSRFPKMMEGAGLSFPALIATLLEQAL